MRRLVNALDQVTPEEQAAQRFEQWLDQHTAEQQERILQYAIDHVLPRLKSRRVFVPLQPRNLGNVVDATPVQQSPPEPGGCDHCLGGKVDAGGTMHDCDFPNCVARPDIGGESRPALWVNRQELARVLAGDPDVKLEAMPDEGMRNARYPNGSPHYDAPLYLACPPQSAPIVAYSIKWNDRHVGNFFTDRFDAVTRCAALDLAYPEDRRQVVGLCEVPEA